MLMSGNNNLIGSAVSSYLKSKDMQIKDFSYQEMIGQSASYRHHTMIFNIIDHELPAADFIELLNKNRFKLYDNVVVVIADSQIAKLCIELLYLEKVVVLSEKSPLRDFGLLTTLSTRAGNPRLYRSKKRLTDREQQILSLLVNGCSPKEISYLVNLDYKTIQTHKMKIIVKLGLVNSSELNRLIVRFNHRQSFLSV